MNAIRMWALFRGSSSRWCHKRILNSTPSTNPMEHTATNLSKQLLLFREARGGSHQTCRSRTRLTTNPTHAAQRPTVRREPEAGASPWGRKGVFEPHIGHLQPLVHTPEGQSPETPSWEHPRDSCRTHLHPWALASDPPADAAAAPGLGWEKFTYFFWSFLRGEWFPLRGNDFSLIWGPPGEHPETDWRAPCSALLLPRSERPHLPRSQVTCICSWRSVPGALAFATTAPDMPPDCLVPVASRTSTKRFRRRVYIWVSLFQMKFMFTFINIII